MIETAPPARKCFYASFQQTSQGCGTLLAGLVGLLLTQCQIGLRLPKIIQARLADRHDLGLGGEQGEFLHVAERNVGHFAGMQANRGVYRLESAGDLQGLPRRLQIRGDADDLRHLRRLRASDDLRQFLRKVRIAEMCVRIDEHDA